MSFRSSTSSWRWSARACGSTFRAWRRSASASPSAPPSSSAGSGARGRGVHDRVAPAALADPVRQAGAVAQAPWQDGLLHRCSRAPGHPRRARDRAGDRGVARAHEAEVHLPRRLPGLIADGRAPAHHLQPDRHRHRPPVEHRPEPAEHPDPHRAGARDPRLLRGRARPASHLGRLLAGGAAAARAHRRRARAQGDLPPRRGCAHRHRGGDPGRQDRPGDALEGEDGQLRHRLRAVGLRARRPPPDRPGGGAGVHRPLLRALPEGQGLHRRDDRARPQGGLRDHAVRAHTARPELRSRQFQTRSLGSAWP